MTKRFCRLLAVLLLLASLLGGCSDKTAGQVFRLDILSEPSSIDPQTALLRRAVSDFAQYDGGPSQNG